MGGLVDWCTGEPVYWFTGLLVYSSAGVLVCWCTGVLVLLHWKGGCKLMKGGPAAGGRNPLDPATEPRSEAEGEAAAVAERVGE